MIGSICIAILGIFEVIATIIWHKKINPETSWIYSVYAISLVTLFSISVNGID